MRIGIITYWETEDNYGQVLQCWALQNYLKRQGHDAFLILYKKDQELEQKVQQISPYCKIKYFCRQFLKMCLIFPLVRYLRRQKKQNKIIRYYDKRNKQRKFEDFKTQYITSSKEVFDNIDELVSHPPVADAYITGSDQVWYFSHKLPNMKAYFLQFGSPSTLRIAYAPSIGASAFPEWKEEILKQFLASFDAISVREKSALDIIEAVGYTATHVLDPTLLLTSSDYKQLETTDVNRKYSYLYIYSLNYQTKEDLPWQEIQTFVRDNNMQIVVTPGSGYTPCSEIFDNVEYDYTPVGHWISNIRNADLIITASFHGIVFAILYHKKFIFTPLRGFMAQSNTRVLSLLSVCGLENCILNENKKIYDMYNNKIDWTDVDKKLGDMRIISEKFLKESLRIKK